MEAGGTTPAGSGRALRPDPFALPVRFSAQDAGADGHLRQVELHRERVILRRAVRGMRMAIGVPVSDFLGVALCVATASDAATAAIAVELAHRDRALSVPLFLAADAEEVMAVWQAWGQVLGLPLLVADGESLRELFPRLGRVKIGAPAGRRRRRTAIRRRRPTILLRRRPGNREARRIVHRGEREIIART